MGLERHTVGHALQYAANDLQLAFVAVSYTHLAQPDAGDPGTALRGGDHSGHGPRVGRHINRGQYCHDAGPVSYTHLDVYKRQG